MDKNDFWTHIVLAVASFLFTLPALVSPWQGPRDTYKVLFITSPLVMAGLAWWGHRQAQSEMPVKGGEE